MRLFRFCTVVCLFSLVLSPSVSYKILIVPLVQGSHVSCLMSIARELGRRQHQTHNILLDEGYKIDRDMDAEAKAFNITFVHLIQNKDYAQAKTSDAFEQVVHLMFNNELPFSNILDIVTQWIDAHANLLLLENEPLIKKLKSVNFDLAVIDGVFSTKHFYLLAHRLGIPWITYTDYPDPWIMRVPWLPSFVPGKYSFQSEKMSFTDRMSNILLSTIVTLKQQKTRVPDHIVNQYQKYGTFDSPDELMEKSGFWILTSDVIIDSPKPLMSNMIETGGLTTQPAKKLPEDIQTFLDGAEDGVVVMSFGSMMSSFPDKLLRKFLEAFRRIERHKIIWRLTNVSSDFHIPDFIRTDRWLPQNDIMAHPKVQLFITHCGNNGQFEALYHGVPMLGFPFIVDQQYNAIRMEYKGFGIAMDVYKFTSDELHANVMKILNDPSYKRRISLASEIFRSAPQRPAERAAYWIEHVIKFGSDHLQSAAKDLNFYQFYMLDAVAMCLVVGVLLLILMMKVVTWASRKCLKLKYSVKLKEN